MTPEEFRNSPLFAVAMEQARQEIAALAECADELITLAIRFRQPGPKFVVYERRVASLASGLQQKLDFHQLAGLAGVLIERVIDLQVLDEGVPRES